MSLFLTFIHAVKDLVQLFLSEVTVVFFPVVSGFTPQDHKFPLSAPKSSKMGNLHNHRPGVESRGETKEKKSN